MFSFDFMFFEFVTSKERESFILQSRHIGTFHKNNRVFTKVFISFKYSLRCECVNVWDSLQLLNYLQK